jgi:hypothetical protein
MSFPVTFVAVFCSDNTKRAGAIAVVDLPRIRELRSIFSSVVLGKVDIQVWLQKSFGRIYVVGPYPNTMALPTTAEEVLSVPHARMLATNGETDVIHSFQLPVVPLEYDLSVVPIRSGHPDIWFGLGSSLGSGAQGTSLVIRAEITVECSGHSFGLTISPVTGFDLGISTAATTSFSLARVESEDHTRIKQEEED